MRWEVVLVILACGATVLPLTPSHGDEISDDEADRIADALFSDDDNESTEKLFKVLSVPDPETLPDDQDEGESMVDVFEVKPRFGLNWGSAILKATRTIGNAVRSKLRAFFNSLRKASKFVLNKIRAGTQKIWEKLKNKFGGDFKNRMKKAGKKLVKKVVKELYEDAQEMAVEYIQAMVIDYIHTKTVEEFCECPMEENPDRCRCCITPPGFAKACMVVRARPKLQWFIFSFRYNGTEFMKAKIAPTEERGKCDTDEADEARRVCQNLPHYLHFLRLCFLPGDIYETEDGFLGCFRLSVDSLALGVEKCVLFTNTEEGIGVTSLATPSDLGLEDEM